MMVREKNAGRGRTQAACYEMHTGNDQESVNAVIVKLASLRILRQGPP